MVRTTTIPSEWQVMQAQQPPGVAPTHMTAVARRCNCADSRRRARMGPAEVAWPVVTGPYDETETTIVKTVDTATHRWRTTITSGDRTHIVTTWRTECLTLPGLAVVYDFSWLGAGEIPFTGSALQCGELVDENYATPADRWFHNPNMGGQGFWFPADPHRLYGGRRIYYRADTVNGVHESCVAPVDFFSGPIPNTFQDHGGDEFRPALYHRFRHYQRIALHYENNPRLHRADYWFYCPVEINNADRPFVGYNVFHLAAVNLEFDEVYIGDIANETVRKPEPFNIPAEPFRFVDRFISKVFTFDSGDVEPAVSASDIPSGYGFIAVRRSSDDFCVAAICKISDTDETDGIMTSLSSALPNQFNVRTSVFDTPPGGPGDRGPQPSTTLQITTKTTTKRPKGWIGWATWVYAGAYADLMATAVDAYAAGLLDEPGWQALPGAVVKGTGFTGVSGGDHAVLAVPP